MAAVLQDDAGRGPPSAPSPGSRPAYETTDCTGNAHIAVHGIIQKVLRSSVVAMLGGLGGQTVGFIGNGNYSTLTWNSSKAKDRGGLYACR